MKLAKNKKYLQQKIFTDGTFTPNYRRFYVEGRQELCPFYI